MFGFALPSFGCWFSSVGSPLILALLVGRSVTTQVPSSSRNTNNNNTNNKKKFKNSKPKEIYHFQH
jgi:hypothetical protein